MEEWKFFNYSVLSPVFALSFTTDRWGLEALPGNLVAVTGYWNKTNTSDPAEVWALPHSCSHNPTDVVDVFDVVSDTESDQSSTLEISLNSDYINNISLAFGPAVIPASATFCSIPQSCPTSGCITLVEGIGKTSTRPTHSNIVGLSHGISVLLSLIFTTALIMGCGGSKPPRSKSWDKEKDARRTPNGNQLNQQQLRRSMNPPHPPVREKREADVVAPPNMIKDVARCSELLRQMYALDLSIWGMRDCIPDEVPKREELKRKAESIFAEILRVLQTWNSAPSNCWSAEEKALIKKITDAVNQHEARRYT